MIIVITWEESVALAAQVAWVWVVGRFVRMDRTVGFEFSPPTAVEVDRTAEQLDEVRNQERRGALG